MTSGSFEREHLRWREVSGDYGPYKVRHDYTILGYDLEAGTLDMLVRWSGDGGHCPIHRHTATTTVLVLEGEQHVRDVLADGSLGAPKVRTAGEHALLVGDLHPHLECGGPDGGLAFFGCHSADGLLYEIVDDQQHVVANVTMESLIADWKANS